MIAAVALQCSTGRSSAQDAPLTEKLVLVLIDGLRYSEGLGDPTRQHVPNMGALAAQGTIVEPFLNDSITVSNRAIPALYCGSWEPPYSYYDTNCAEDNLASSRPSVHEYFRKQLGRPASDCAYIIGSACPWAGSFHPDYGPAYWPGWVSTGGVDNANWAAAQTVLTTVRPSFTTLYLPAVDSAGHSGNWNNYVAAVENADQIVGDLWALLQADPEYAGQTTLIVTNDHGRHDYNFAGHGDLCEGCQRMQFLAVGPGIRSGVVSCVRRNILDVTPTIGALLGFDAEFADGEVMTEILTTGVDGPACNYCSPGASATFMGLASGASTSITTNDFRIEARPVPNSAGLFFFGPTQIAAPFGAGTRCVGGGVLRLQPASIAGGDTASRSVNLTAQPGAVITSGSVWNFQYWFRRSDLVEGFDLSDGLSVQFGP